MQRDKIHVLVVDDAEAMRYRVKDYLGKLGFKKITTADGPDEANKTLKQGGVHLILCDWNMAPVDGKAFLLQVRKDAATKSIAFIMVTAESVIAKVTEAITLGVDDYLVKPFSIEQLESKLQNVLGKKKLEF